MLQQGFPVYDTCKPHAYYTLPTLPLLYLYLTLFFHYVFNIFFFHTVISKILLNSGEMVG